MARLKSGIMFTGPLGDFTAYKMKDSDEIIIRRKGGASRERVLNGPEFEMTRRLNAEFGARSNCCMRIMRGMFPLKVFADGNASGQLNKLLKQIQDCDKESALGNRHIALSRFPALLEGFQFNRKYPFEYFVVSPIHYSIDKNTKDVKVTVPELIPGINLRMSAKHPMYSLVVSAAIVPDLFPSDSKYKPSSEAYENLAPVMAFSDWFASAKGSPEVQLRLSVPFNAPDANFALAVGIGIRFGFLININTVQPSAFGGGKILAVR